MATVPHRVARHHDHSDLPLFYWAERRAAFPPTYAGRWVGWHTGLPPHLAMTIAELAGIGALRKK